MLIFAVKMKLFYPARAKLFGLLIEFAKASDLEGKWDDLACGCHKHCKLKGKRKNLNSSPFRMDASQGDTPCAASRPTPQFRGALRSRSEPHLITDPLVRLLGAELTCSPISEKQNA